jgi:glycine betaine/choline ABC-type transport system substrate-binding protein
MEVESDILNGIIECKTYHKHQPQFGERAWLAEGKEVNILYWDTGNTWCKILDVIPKKAKTKKEQYQIVKKFYRKLRRKIEESYDENMLRVD